MKFYFGAAIQGHRERGQRTHIYQSIISTVKEAGHEVLTEHVASDKKADVLRKLEERFGPIPPAGKERSIWIRNKMIGFVESPDLDAAIFEVSTPSLGTGIEIAHAYLRPRLGLPEIPILLLYEDGYWPHKLSSMVSGIEPSVAPSMNLEVYRSEADLGPAIAHFLNTF